MVSNEINNQSNRMAFTYLIGFRLRTWNRLTENLLLDSWDQFIISCYFDLHSYYIKLGDSINDVKCYISQLYIGSLTVTKLCIGLCSDWFSIIRTTYKYIWNVSYLYLLLIMFNFYYRSNLKFIWLKSIQTSQSCGWIDWFNL